MKRTELERKERELRRAEKKQEILAKKGADRPEQSVGSYINLLAELYRHDDTKIYNIQNDEDILEAMLEIKEYIPEKQWDNIIKKSVRKTKITNKEEAYRELYEMLED